jgi:hypothetical protein
MASKKTLKLLDDLALAIVSAETIAKHLKTLGSPLSHQRKLDDSIVMMRHLLEKHGQA